MSPVVLLRDAVPFCSLHVLCLSVRMVWNIECCLFLLWLGRQGARWQTTRDRIDFAAFFCEVGLMWLLSTLSSREGISPGCMYEMPLRDVCAKKTQSALYNLSGQFDRCLDARNAPFLLMES